MLGTETVGQCESQLNLLLHKHVVETTLSLPESFFSGKLLTARVETPEDVNNLEEVFELKINHLLTSPALIQFSNALEFC